MLLPIVFLKQDKNSISIYLNSLSMEEYKGYGFIHYYPKEKPELDNSLLATSQEMTIYNLSTGIYVFYLADAIGNKTPQQEIYLIGETNKQAVERLTSYIINEEDREYVLKNCFNRYETYRKNGNSFSEIVVNNYRNIQEPMDWETEIYFKILLVTEKYENTLILNSNKELCSEIEIINSPNYGIKAPGWITHVIAVGKDTGIGRKISLKDGAADIPMDADEVYRIEIYADNELAAIIEHYQPDYTMSIYIRQNRMEMGDIDSTILADINLNSMEMELSDTEKTRIAEEKYFAPKNWLVYRPSLKEKANEIHIEVSVDNTDILNVLDKPFYITAKDEDIFADQTIQARNIFKKNGQTFNTYLEGISDKAVYYITDKSGKAVSKYARTDENYPDYESNKQKLECLEYKKSLMSALSPLLSGTDFNGIIDGEIKRLADEQDSNPEKMLHDILLFLSAKEGIDVSRGRLYMAIINHWLSQFDVDEKFFDTQTIAFYNSASSIRFPVRSTKYVLVRAGWNTNGTNIHPDYKLSDPFKDTEFETNQFDFNVFYCISEDDYRRSGFIFVSNVYGENAMASNIFSIEEGLISNG